MPGHIEMLTLILTLATATVPLQIALMPHVWLMPHVTTTTGTLCVYTTAVMVLTMADGLITTTISQLTAKALRIITMTGTGITVETVIATDSHGNEAISLTAMGSNKMASSRQTKTGSRTISVGNVDVMASLTVATPTSKLILTGISGLTSAGNKWNSNANAMYSASNR